MTRILCPSAWFILIPVLLGGVTSGLAQEAVRGQHPARFEATVQRKVAFDYLLFLPSKYDARGSTRWPLIVFLHGAGERGTNVQQVAVHGPPKRVQTQPDFPFVVLSPQCPPGTHWDTLALDGLLDSVLGSHAIDPKRVYLTGLSMGGYGTWAWSSARPERFAAIAPICGGGDPVGIWLAGGARRESLVRLPVWAFHGAKDEVVPLSASQQMVDAYKRLSNNARLTVYPDAGHDSWTATYENSALYEWFQQHRLP